jgi:hypothetical protein
MNQPLTPQPTHAAVTTALGVLRTCGYAVRIAYRDDEQHTRHFAITALGGCLADTPLGEIGLTADAMLFPVLNADAELLGFGLNSTGPVLLRFLVEISAAIDRTRELSSEWDFTPDPGSPIAAPPGAATRTERAWAA